tara:strand:+ start:2515 stop:2802 length:288 start_codon:yes stop_codon:yes gene_type:complete
MKIKEIAERVGAEALPTGRLIAYVKDAVQEINMLSETHFVTRKFDISKDQRFYELPDDVIKITDIRCKNHMNNRNEYQSIPRIIGEPATEDVDGK